MVLHSQSYKGVILQLQVLLSKLSFANGEAASDLVVVHQVRLSLEVMRADVEEFGGKAYRMGKGSKDDTVVALLKDQLDEFKQVLYMLS